MQRKFQLGQLVATPGAIDALQTAGMHWQQLLDRHVAGDWGDVCDEDKQSNDRDLKEGNRLLSAYEIGDDTKVWIITEADRSVTTILLPDEY